MTNTGHNINILLERKLKALNHFLSVTRDMKKALAAEKMEEVNCNIKNRDELIRVIGILDKVIAHAVSSEEQRIGPDILQEIRNTIEQITVESEACERLSAIHCQELKGELNSIRNQGRGLHGYARQRDFTPRFVSLES